MTHRLSLKSTTRWTRGSRHVVAMATTSNSFMEATVNFRECICPCLFHIYGYWRSEECKISADTYSWNIPLLLWDSDARNVGHHPDISSWRHWCCMVVYISACIQQESQPIENSHNSQHGNHQRPGTTRLRAKWIPGFKSCWDDIYVNSQSVLLLAFIPWLMGMKSLGVGSSHNSQHSLSPLILTLVMGLMHAKRDDFRHPNTSRGWPIGTNLPLARDHLSWKGKLQVSLHYKMR